MQISNLDNHKSKRISLLVSNAKNTENPFSEVSNDGIKSEIITVD